MANASKNDVFFSVFEDLVKESTFHQPIVAKPFYERLTLPKPEPPNLNASRMPPPRFAVRLMRCFNIFGFACTQKPFAYWQYFRMHLNVYYYFTT